MILLPLSLVLVLNSLGCLGVHCLTREGMLFEQAANFIRHYVGEFWSKPLFDCPPCMASVWGLIGWLYFVTDLHLIPYLLILCGLNALTSKMYYHGD
jgi:hypothetical protein